MLISVASRRDSRTRWNLVITGGGIVDRPRTVLIVVSGFIGVIAVGTLLMRSGAKETWRITGEVLLAMTLTTGGPLLLVPFLPPLLWRIRHGIFFSVRFRWLTRSVHISSAAILAPPLLLLRHSKGFVVAKFAYKKV